MKSLSSLIQTFNDEKESYKIAIRIDNEINHIFR